MNRDDYRFGYQGQFAEKDDETGWNAFELRMFDPVIGRWLTVDPHLQYYSPYLGMGNNPVLRFDPNGGEDLTGDPATLALSEQFAITAERYWFWNVVEVLNEADWVASGEVKVDLGVAAKIKANIGPLKAEADVNVASVNLLKAGGDFTEEDSWKYNYIGDGEGALVTNSIGLGIYAPIQGGSNQKIGIGGYAEQHQTVHHLAGAIFKSKDYGYSYGADVLYKSPHKTNGLLKDAGLETKIGKEKDFYGINVGVGAQFLLGIDANIKLGFKY